MRDIIYEIIWYKILIYISIHIKQLFKKQKLMINSKLEKKKVQNNHRINGATNNAKIIHLNRIIKTRYI